MSLLPETFPHRESFWARVDRWAADHFHAVLIGSSLACGPCACAVDFLRKRSMLSPWLGRHPWFSGAALIVQGALIVAFVPGAIVARVWTPGLLREFKRKDRPAVRSSVLVGSLLLFLGGILACMALGWYASTR